MRHGCSDHFQFSASGFGGDLTVGKLAASQLQSRADDRFIFRSTDRTLWFDDDGNGAHAAVQVAELQTGATVTAVDIIIV